MRSSSGTNIQQDWSPSNILHHTLVPEDVTSNTMVVVYIRNSDGWGQMDTVSKTDMQVGVRGGI